MNGKTWLWGLLAVVVLAGGCGEDVKKKKADKGIVKLEGNVVKSQSNVVKLETSMGNIIVELDAQAAPVTVKNFLRYVEEGFFDGTIFHRVIPGFMIQGGGFTKELERKETHDAVINEAGNGLKNERGTIAMARTNDPDSATAQFFINHGDNDFLNYVENRNPGYAVFGRTIEGMDVVDAVASVETATRMGMDDVPVEPVVIESASVVPK